ncbi:MAG: septum formation initiator [Bacteroidetes bacterium GWA2_30_7]|nr:MAG: septum formation initiator [Bacteroidetes bacterium GWA2_30_7]
MINFLKKIWKYILPVIKNKYILTIIFFIVWVTFFDNNNLLDRINNIGVLNQLHKDQEYYKEKITIDTKRLEELRTDKENLEKFAREQYLMKKKNEDIFIMVDGN